MTSQRKLMMLLVPLLTAGTLLTGCVEAVVVERPKEEASQAEEEVCRSLAEYFPTWAYDGFPETVANRVDTEASVEEGITFTRVFRAVCPGELPS